MTVEPHRGPEESRRCRAREGPSRPILRSARRRTPPPRSTRRRRPTSRASGRSSPASGSTGTRRSRRRSNGTCRSRSGSSAASSTSPTTASTGTSSQRARRQGRLPLDRRARRHPDDHLRRPPARGLEGRERAQGARRADRRPRRDLHADDPGAADRDARLRPDRRAAHGRLRRLQRRGARRPDRGHPGQAAHHRRRRLAARQARSDLKTAADEALANSPDHRARARRPAPGRRASRRR